MNCTRTRGIEFLPEEICERCGDRPIAGFNCTDIPAELHTELFKASSAVLCPVCSGMTEHVGTEAPAWSAPINLVGGEADDILYMLEDYIMNMEDRLECYGENAIELDDGLQVDQANLAVACRHYDKIKAVFGKRKVRS